MLLNNKSGHVEENDVEVFHHFACPLLSSSRILSPFRENSYAVVFPFPLHGSMPLVNLWFIGLQG